MHPHKKGLQCLKWSTQLWVLLPCSPAYTSSNVATTQTSTHPHQGGREVPPQLSLSPRRCPMAGQGQALPYTLGWILTA